MLSANQDFRVFKSAISQGKLDQSVPESCSSQIAESIIFQEQQLMNQFDFWQANKESKNVKIS